MDEARFKNTSQLLFYFLRASSFDKFEDGVCDSRYSRVASRVRCHLRQRVRRSFCDEHWTISISCQQKIHYCCINSKQGKNQIIEEYWSRTVFRTHMLHGPNGPELNCRQVKTAKKWKEGTERAIRYHLICRLLPRQNLVNLMNTQQDIKELNLECLA